MRIAFDTSPLVRAHPPGVVRATRGLVEALEARRDLTLVRFEPEPGESLRGFRHVELMRRARAAGCDLVHSPVSAFPRGGELPRVHTLHELPWRQGVRENADWRHQLWAELGPRWAAGTLVPSEHVRRGLGPFVPRERVHVVPWGLAPAFAAASHASQSARAPFVLAVGALRPKKRLEATLAGVAELARSGTRLSVVATGAVEGEGDRLVKLAAHLGVALALVGAVDDTELARLYASACAVSVLSHSEGFGFPVLEALAFGTAVLVPSASAQAELAGDVGFEVDPGEPTSVAQGLREALDGNPELSRARSARASEFSFARAAESVASLWRGVLA